MPSSELKAENALGGGRGEVGGRSGVREGTLALKGGSGAGSSITMLGRHLSALTYPPACPQRLHLARVLDS